MKKKTVWPKIINVKNIIILSSVSLIVLAFMVNKNPDSPALSFI